MHSVQKPYLGIALSGGQLKAAAHVGVLNALEKLGIYPDVIAGTSAGSLVTTLYAHGYRGDQFHRLLNQFPGIRILDYGFPLWSSMYSWTAQHLWQHKKKHVPLVPAGLLRGRKLTHYIERLIAKRRVQIPFYIVATDLLSGQPVVFSSEETPTSERSDAYARLHDIPRAVAGSCALPGIFSPVVLDDFILVDGAMRHYVPVSVLRDIGCQKIIAVNLYRLPAHYRPVTLVDVLARSFDILLRESIDNDIAKDPDVYVLEPDLSGIRWRSFVQMQECLNIGQALVEKHRTALQSFVR